MRKICIPVIVMALASPFALGDVAKAGDQPRHQQTGAVHTQRACGGLGGWGRLGHRWAFKRCGSQGVNSAWRRSSVPALTLPELGILEEKQDQELYNQTPEKLQALIAELD